MAPQTVSVTVSYSKPGTQPPLYLAGSFSEWLPEEMQYTTDENKEHEFHKEVEVEQGKEYQYKFRLGLGEWWTLNENEPTVTDDLGNKNNLLTAPRIGETTANPEESASMQEPQAEQAETAPAPVMEKEATPSIEETMGTRETDDALFADEIVPDTKAETHELNENMMEGITEPHATPAMSEKLEPTQIEEVNHVKELRDIEGSEAKQDPVGTSLEGIIEPHATPSIEKPESEHVEEIAHVKVLQDIRGTDTSDSKIEEEDVIEPTPTPLMDFKKIHHLEDMDSQNVSDDQAEEDKAVAPPALVVEKAEDKDSHTPELHIEEAEVKPKQDDTSLETATNEPASSNLLNADTSAEDMSRLGARTPDLANVAAEVADVAATLDPEEPTPSVSDDEAGRTGYRRMSATPIPQVALTAAEVADSAAIIDKEVEEEDMKKDTKELKQPVEFIRPFDIDDGPLPETPPNERVPRFSHECGSPPDHLSPCRHEDTNPFEGMVPQVYEEPDLNDPGIKMFPTDRAGILDHIRRMQERLPPDEVKLDLAPPSPVVGPNGRPERLNLPAISPVVLAQRSPSLDSIPEQNDEEIGMLEPSVIKLNNEDKPQTNGVTVPKAEIDAISGHTQKENETPINKADGNPRDLAGTVDSSGERSQNIESKEAAPENIESKVSDPAVAAKADSTGKSESAGEQGAAESHLAEPEAHTSAEEDKETTGTEDQNVGPINQNTGRGESTIPSVEPIEKSTKHGTEESMDGVCEEGFHRVPSPITPFIVGDRQLGHDDEDVRELSTGALGPSITIQPATPFASLNRQLGNEDEHAQESKPKDTGSSVADSTIAPGSSTMTDSTIKHNDQAKSSAIEDEDDQGQVLSRKRQSSPSRIIERPVTPNSVRSNGKKSKDIKGGNIIKTILRVVFVEWIGGFIMRLCGGRRRGQVLLVGAVTIIALLPTLYYFDMIPATFMESLQRLHIPSR